MADGSSFSPDSHIPVQSAVAEKVVIPEIPKPYPFGAVVEEVGHTEPRAIFNPIPRDGRVSTYAIGKAPFGDGQWQATKEIEVDPTGVSSTEIDTLGTQRGQLTLDEAKTAIRNSITRIEGPYIPIDKPEMLEEIIERITSITLKEWIKHEEEMASVSGAEDLSELAGLEVHHEE